MAELKQFCILASKQKGRACAALIQQVISNKKIFNFGDLLSMPSVLQLNDSDSEYISYYKTLELFAYGKYNDYANAKEKYLELNETQITKLKQLTIVSLSAKSRKINYSLLRSELDINDVRLLEDLIIDTIYLGLIKGKLNQRNQILRITDTIRRDVSPDQLGELVANLKIWQETVASLIQTVDNSSTIVKNRRESGRLELEDTQKHVDATKALVKERAEGTGSSVGSVIDLVSKASRVKGGGRGQRLGKDHHKD